MLSIGFDSENEGRSGNTFDRRGMQMMEGFPRNLPQFGIKILIVIAERCNNPLTPQRINLIPTTSMF